MSTGEKNLEQQVDLIANELAKTIGGNFDIIVPAIGRGDAIDKLAMIVNTILATVKNSISALELTGKRESNLLRALIKLLSETKSIESEEALIKNLMRFICETENLEIAHYYKIKKNKLESSKIWHINSQHDYKNFIKVTESTSFKKGEGLPGLVWKNKKGSYFKNVYQEKNFLRAKKEDEKTMKVVGALAFPVVVSGDILGVVELYDNKELRFEQNYLQFYNDLVDVVVFYYIEKTFDYMARNAHSDGLIAFGPECEILSANISAEKIFQLENKPYKNKKINDIFCKKFLNNNQKLIDKISAYQNCSKNDVVLKVNKKKYFISYTLKSIIISDKAKMLLFSFYNFTKEHILTEELKEKVEEAYQARNQLSAVLDTIVDPVIVFQKNGKIEFSSANTKLLLGFMPQEMLSVNIFSILKDLDQKTFLKNSKKLSIKTTAATKHHEKLSILFGVSQLSEKDSIYVGILRDISKEEKQAAYIKTISAIQKLYITGADRNDVFHFILNFFIRHTGSTFGFIGPVFEEKTTYSIKAYAVHREGQSQKKHGASDASSDLMALPDFYLNSLKKDYTAVHVASVASSMAHPPSENTYLHHIAIPICSNDRVIAMIGLARNSEQYQTDIGEELSSILTVVSTIVESSRNYSLIEKMATTDDLTGAFNRFYFKNYLNETLRTREQSAGNQFCIMMLDLNKFKDINDFYGHGVGDKILVEFVKRVKASIKKRDLIARIGGDEFCLFVDEIYDFNRAGTLAKRIIAACQKPYFIDKKKIECGASVGIACYPDSGKNIDELYRHADLALYKAKKNKSCFSYFSKELEEKYLRNMRAEKEAKELIKKELFTFFFQPIVDIDSEKIVGIEALLRPTTATTLSTEEIINKTEEIGYGSLLNKLAFKKIIGILEGLKCKKNLCNFPVFSINISPQTNELIGDINYLNQLIANSKHLSQLKFTLEITESAFEDMAVDLNEKSPIICALDTNGISLSMDDFGTKCSTILRVIDCKFKTIKIDKTITQKIDQPGGHKALTMIKAMAIITRDLGVKMIAEGAESQAQIDLLRSINVKLVQGFFYYQPLDIKALAKLIGCDYDATRSAV